MHRTNINSCCPPKSKRRGQNPIHHSRSKEQVLDFALGAYRLGIGEEVPRGLNAVSACSPIPQTPSEITQRTPHSLPFSPAVPRHTERAYRTPSMSQHLKPRHIDERAALVYQGAQRQNKPSFRGAGWVLCSTMTAKGRRRPFKFKMQAVQEPLSATFYGGEDGAPGKDIKLRRGTGSLLIQYFGSHKLR